MAIIRTNIRNFAKTLLVIVTSNERHRVLFVYIVMTRREKCFLPYPYILCGLGS